MLDRGGARLAVWGDRYCGQRRPPSRADARLHGLRIGTQTPTVTYPSAPSRNRSTAGRMRTPNAETETAREDESASTRQVTPHSLERFSRSSASAPAVRPGAAVHTRLLSDVRRTCVLIYSGESWATFVRDAGNPTREQFPRRLRRLPRGTNSSRRSGPTLRFGRETVPAARPSPSRSPSRPQSRDRTNRKEPQS